MVPLSIEALIVPPPPRGAPPVGGGIGFQQIVADLVGGGVALSAAAMSAPADAPAEPIADPELLLAQFITRQEATTPPELAADPDIGLPLDRQDLAGDEGGHPLPDEDEPEAAADAAVGFAWFTPPLPSAAPASAVSVAVRVANRAPASPEQAAIGAQLVEQTIDLGRLADKEAPQPMLAAEWKALAAKLEAEAAVPAQRQAQQPQPLQAQQPQAAQLIQPVVPPPVAAPVLAAMVASTLGNPVDKADSPAPDPTAVDALAALRPNHSPVAHRIEAAGGASGAGVDTARAEWIEAMIERIDEFQSQRDAHSTRIRLAPDALGTVDVSIRRENGVVHVNFAAENPAARSLLADATPRLAELAEARGLRLGDAGVGSQGSPDSREQPAQPRIVDERAPNRAPRAGARTETQTGERIA